MELYVLATAIVVLLTAVVGLLTKLRSSVKEVHVLVNDRMTEALNRIDQLIFALTAAGVKVPAQPAREDVGGN